MMSINAKIEFLEHLARCRKGASDVAKAAVYFESVSFLRDANTEAKLASLNENHSESEYAEFLGQLDFEYSSEYGCQWQEERTTVTGHITGYIWYTDGSWSERKEINGIERWSFVERPNFDAHLSRMVANLAEADLASKRLKRMVADATPENKSV